MEAGAKREPCSRRMADQESLVLLLAVEVAAECLSRAFEQRWSDEKIDVVTVAKRRRAVGAESERRAADDDEFDPGLLEDPEHLGSGRRNCVPADLFVDGGGPEHREKLGRRVDSSGHESVVEQRQQVAVGARRVAQPVQRVTDGRAPRRECRGAFGPWGEAGPEEMNLGLRERAGPLARGEPASYGSRGSAVQAVVFAPGSGGSKARSSSISRKTVSVGGA